MNNNSSDRPSETEGVFFSMLFQNSQVLPICSSSSFKTNSLSIFSILINFVLIHRVLFPRTHSRHKIVVAIDSNLLIEFFTNNIYFKTSRHNSQYKHNYMSIKHLNGVTCILSFDGRCTRHKTQIRLRSDRYSTGQKHCKVCETFIEWDGTFRPFCGHKLKTRRRNRECKIELDSTELSSKKANLVCNSIGACVDHTRSKSNFEVPDGQTSYENPLIHEHDLSVIAENKNYIVRCLTCNVCFCGLCGKALNYPRIHTDGLA